MSHLSSPRGESSKTVPVFTVNWRLSGREPHCPRLYFSMNRTVLEPHRGQITPSGQRRTTTYSRQVMGSENYTMAS